MSKFELVKGALEEKTRNTDNFITLIKNVDARHSGKYTTQNILTKNTSNISYKTLKEVINEFDLKNLIGKKKIPKRILEVDDEEYYILKRAVDFLTSSYLSLKPANIRSDDLYALDNRLTGTKFEDLPEVLDNK